MKKTGLLFLTAFSFCIQYLSAQQNKFDVGILAGPNFNKLAGNDAARGNSKNVTYYTGGLNLQYNFPKLFSISSGVFFDRKGGASQVVLTDAMGRPVGKFKLKTHLDYVLIPLLAKFSFGEKAKAFIGAGGYMGYFLSSSQGSGEMKFSTDELYAKQDFGALINLGGSLPLGKRLSLSLEGRYALGLKNISSVEVNSGTLNTRSFSVLLGLNFRFGNRDK